jgi:uncharacterized protein (DUF488 family)
VREEKKIRHPPVCARHAARRKYERMQTLWTIGHSTRNAEEFIALLKENEIRALADVRQFPGSRRYPHFGREALAEMLTREGIEYFHFPELGGRRRAKKDSHNTAWRNESFRGYADYMETPAFREGVRRLLKIARTRSTVIMCAEAVWWRCHRALISDFLKTQGHEVIHIFASGKTEAHPLTSAARIVDDKLSYRAPETDGELNL